MSSFSSITSTKRSLLLLALALFAPSLALADDGNGCPPDKPWAITLGGDASYDCSVTSPGAAPWTTECGKGKTICASSIDDLTTGGGAIHLFSSGADQSVPGTLIECTFTSQTANANHMSASNCDISMVDGYNFDVQCRGDISLGSRSQGWQPEKCASSPGAQLNQNAGVCLDPNGKSINTIQQAPQFFQDVVMGPNGQPHKGVYVAANQVGVPVPFQNTATSGHIFCDVNGGMIGYGSGSQTSKRDELDAVVAQPAESPVERREEHTHRLRHATRARVAAHAHARGLDSVLGDVAASGKI